MRRSFVTRSWSVCLVATALLGSFLLPWGGSGSRGRTPFELRSSALSLDLVDGLTEWVIRWAIPAIPPLVGLAWLCLATDHHGLLRGLGVVIGLTAAIGAWAVWRSPLSNLGGLTVAASAATALLVVALIPATRSLEDQ